jgi:choline dehydrogenase-like flavoprotein
MSAAYDFVIIGSGAGGAAAAWALTARGAAVLLLEAGPVFNPARDYPHSNADWEAREFPSPQGSRAQIIYGDLGKLNARDSDLASFDAVTPRAPMAAMRSAQMGGYVHVLGVGGDTLHEVGEAHRLHPRSFALARDYGAGFDWPISYDDLEPFYQQIEQFIGVAGPAQSAQRPRSAPLPLPPHPLSPAAARLVEAGPRLGLPFEANTRAALSQPFDTRPTCNYCGQCSKGCPTGAKGSADVTFIRHALATGKLTLIANAPVVRIEQGAGGVIVAVEYVQDGQLYRQETPVLIVAAGAVQTPRLLLASGLANGSGQVGRNFMETLTWSSTALLNGLQGSHMGLPADAVSWAHNAPDGVAGAVGGCRYTSAVQEAGFTGPFAYAQRLIAGYGAAFHRKMQRAFGSAITVGATGAVVADARSNISLSRDQVDANGLPLPVIASVLTDNSLNLLRHMRANCRALLAACGANAPIAEGGSWDVFRSKHVSGTARMGADSATSVTDQWGRSHDHPNLYIADASLFPSNGGGESPSLTVSALALRQAEHIA